MQNDMRDRLVELINQRQDNGNYKTIEEKSITLEFVSNEKLADHLIANGVIVFDMNVISPENRPLITHIATMPLDDVLELIQQKLKEMRVENE